MMLSRIIVASAIISLPAYSLAQSTGKVDCSLKANESHEECVELPVVSSQSIPLNLLPLIVGGAVVIGVISGGGDDGSSSGTN